MQGFGKMRETLPPSRISPCVLSSLLVLVLPLWPHMPFSAAASLTRPGLQFLNHKQFV